MRKPSDVRLILDAAKLLSQAALRLDGGRPEERP